MTDPTNTELSELEVIALAAGMAIEKFATNPPKLAGFAKFSDGRVLYTLSVEDFASIVSAARADSQAQIASVMADRDKLQMERDALMDSLHDEMTENFRLRDLGGALKDEDMPTFLARVFRERDEAMARVASLTWRPIDTAPKDGTNVLLLNRKGNVSSGLWQGLGVMQGWWLRGANRPSTFFNDHFGPTHWMPWPDRPGDAAPSPPTLPAGEAP